MVAPIVLLTVCLILTFGGTLSRLFDRLRLGFRGAVLAQFWLIAAAVFPHVAQGTPHVQNAFAVTAVFMLAAAGAAYLAKIRAAGRRVSLRALAGAAALAGVNVGLSVWLAALEMPEFAVQFLIGLFTAGLAFAVSYDHTDAFLMCVFSYLAACAVLFFSPLYFVLSIAPAQLAARTVNGTVYSLIGALTLMNLFKRVRGYYAEDRKSGVRLDR